MPQKLTLTHRDACLLALVAVGGLALALICSCSEDNPTEPERQVPVVAFTTPADGDTLETDTTLVAVTATDNVGVVRVDFFADSVPLGSVTQEPYSLAWVWGDLANNSFHTLRATAVDKAGNEGHDTLQVFLPQPEPPDTVPPVVAITSPLEGAVVVGHPAITATATDTGSEGAAVASVSFFAGTALLGIDTEAPFEQVWNTEGSPLGQGYALSVTAEDLAGNSASDTVQVMLQADGTAPSVGITTAPGTALASTDAITAEASDEGGIAEVRFYLGETLVGSDSAEPFEQPALALLYWADGASHEIMAEAEDFAGNAQRSDPVTVTIVKPANAWLSDVLAVAAPGDQDGYHFARLVRLNPEVRYRGTQIDTIDVNTCILGHTALIDYEGKGCLLVMPVPQPDTTRFHIDHCIVINAVNNVRQPAPPRTGLSFGGAIEFASIPGWEEPCGLVNHCTVYRSWQSGLYLQERRGGRLAIKNNIFIGNLMGGCVRNGNPPSNPEDITYNCASENNSAQFGTHCGCPSDPDPTPLEGEELADCLYRYHNITDAPYDPMPKNRPRTLREHFVLKADTPCRDQGEDGTYMGAMPPE